VHCVRSARPSSPLRGYVRAYLQRELEGCPAPVIEPVPARLEPCLHFNLGNAFEVRYSDVGGSHVPPAAIVGHQTSRRCDIVLAGRIEAFGVFFEPTGFSRIFGTPMRDVVDQVCEAGSVLGDAIYTLRARIGEARSFEERVRIVDDFLLRQLARLRRRDRFTVAADQIFTVRGVARIPEIASHIGLSQRQFESGFLAEAGCSPKVYARIARFQTALDIKVTSPDRSWLEIAHSLYYHDQMHMVHDFQSLSGNSPDRLMAELGEARPRAAATAR
jgi:AraC-like DNA-binding protein